MLIEFKNKNHV